MSVGVSALERVGGIPITEERSAGWFSRLFCRHSVVKLKAIGSALVTDGSAILPAIEVRCSRCGEFWHAELDASEAMRLGLEG